MIDRDFKLEEIVPGLFFAHWAKPDYSNFGYVIECDNNQVAIALLHYGDKYKTRDRIVVSRIEFCATYIKNSGTV